MLCGCDINSSLAAMRKALKQYLILSTIILVVVSETKYKLFTCLMSSIPRVVFVKGCVIPRSMQFCQTILCHIIYN